VIVRDVVHEGHGLAMGPSTAEMTGFLKQAEFSTIVRLAPLVSIDLIVCDSDNRVLLGLRKNEPAKNSFFVPGGIVRKNELLEMAFARIVKAEINILATLENATFVGVYDHVYDTNTAGESGYGTRYVALGYRLMLKSISKLRMDAQHNESVWWTEDEILRSDRVHEYAKAYFDRNKR
jgi:colanic acid biosynthesis protein WcaH